MTKPSSPDCPMKEPSMLDRIRLKLRRKEPVFGAGVSLLDPSVSEMLGYAGFDFLWIDMEHTALTKSDVLQHLTAASSGRTAGFVRVPWNDPVLVKPVLDMGPDGIIFPMIRTAEDARLAVSSCEYPPKGIRGCGPKRALRHGMHEMIGYLQGCSDACWKIIQIEHVDCVKNLDAIARVSGVDCWMIGPTDLSGSIGCLGRENAPEMQALLDEIAGQAAHHGIHLGAFTCDAPSALERWQARGVSVFTLGGDTGYLMAAARNSLRQSRQICAQESNGQVQ
jgi:2-keto-3-deoxy-L-rhamnonate aldolase RhmA